ncbi:GIY-YIG nuclease family protein [Mesorhizobium sp. B2-1-2]|uniref:GIY-YIG nuclease family protein n=1 Tax=Mesorhizobium sp. B2-1-2 TaxID=2589973 RepID=UPI00112E58F8|nr:GIY-YIG nuclease family protein [Mesorhizobium sp. B2-1-2]TPN11678.1 hypothetical protein FJ971_09730 [Mesorhizobium sp. B2-1-2]
MGAIYSISFPGSTRCYIGSARNFAARMRVHLSRLRKGDHHSIGLQHAAAKYGLDRIVFETVEIVEDDRRLIDREQAWMDRFKGRLYNRSPLAKSRLGLSMSEVAKAKISASLIGNQYRKGIPHDDLARSKIGDGVRRANAEGRRRQVCMPENLAGFIAAVRSGERIHPSRKPEHDAAIVASHARTKSLKKTAAEFNMSPCGVWEAVRRTNPSQLRKWTQR